MEITSFDQWLDTLSGALNRAKAVGMSDVEIKKSAKELGNFLAQSVDPDVPENRLLKTLWTNGTEQEKEALASMVVKMVQSKNVH